MTDRQSRRYSRLDRVSQAIHEVVADELELIDDDRLELVTVTGAKVDSDLRRARIWYSALVAPAAAAPQDVAESGGASPPQDPIDPVAIALSRHRNRLQAAVARQLRLKRTPELSFVPDPAIATGTRVDDILRHLHGGEKEDE